MSDLIKDKNWTRWTPKKIFFKQKNYFYNKNFIEKDLYTYEDVFIQDKKEVNTHIKNIEQLKKESYEKGFIQGNKESIKREDILKNKIQKLFIDFENSLFSCEKLLFKHLLKTVLIVSAYVIGKNSTISQDILLKNIKKIVKEDGVFLKKPKLIVHPENKTIVENIFLDLLNTYDWKIIYDVNIDINACKVQSESGSLDATIDARWQELCRLVNSEEY